MATGIGETLRAERRRQGRTLAEASEVTRIRETHLAALEQEEFAALGGDVYARGHLRAYARFLGLDPAPLLDAYPAPRPPMEEQAPLPLSRSRPGSERVRPTRAAVVAAVVLVVLVIVVALWFSGGGQDSSGADGAPGSSWVPDAPLPATGSDRMIIVTRAEVHGERPRSPEQGRPA